MTQPTPETLTTAKAILAAAIADPNQRAAVLAKLESPATREKYLTTSKAAALLNVCKKTMFRYEKRGLLHPVRITASRVRWPKSELLALPLDVEA